MNVWEKMRVAEKVFFSVSMKRNVINCFDIRAMEWVFAYLRPFVLHWEQRKIV